jgi:hypothetical protein
MSDGKYEELDPRVTEDIKRAKYTTKDRPENGNCSPGALGNDLETGRTDDCCE